MLKILAISDLHGHLPFIEDCDLLLVGGDICSDFLTNAKTKFMTKGEDLQAQWLDQTFRPWLDELRSRNIEVVAIWGNHDFVGEKSELIPNLDWILLQDETIELFGLKIWGTPWTPNLPYWAFQCNDYANSVRVEQIPCNLDILLTHGPPYGYLDFVAPQFGSCHVGDPDLALELELLGLNPKLVVCGHIHEGRGSMQINDQTQIVNVAHMDENYLNERGPVDISHYFMIGE